MLLVKRSIGAMLTFFSAFLFVVGVGRTRAAGEAASPMQLPIIIMMVLLFGVTGLWLILQKNKAQR